MFALILLLVIPEASQAYVGPGAGLSLLGALWALLAAIGAAVVFVVAWPIRRMRRRRREAQMRNEEEPTAEATAAHRPRPGTEPPLDRDDEAKHLQRQ